MSTEYRVVPLAFLEELASSAGTMVNGNQLSAKAAEIIAAPAPTAGGEPDRSAFEAWVYGVEHKPYGWLGKEWLVRDEGDSYANDYVHGLWASYRAHITRLQEKMRQLKAIGFDHELHGNAASEEVTRLQAEVERLKLVTEKIMDRHVMPDSSPDAFIPSALDAWGRPVPEYLPYDFSGNPGASATQYCNGWNDAGGYWKAHCIDLQSELAKAREALRSILGVADACLFNDAHQSAPAAKDGE